LDASQFGAPTRRRRLFLVARCDGRPIRWPEPTHGPGLLPYRTAAECIDWSIPCPSIFGRKKPLAEKTLRRIALGIKRFVVGTRPFIAPVAGGPKRELVAAFLAKHYGGHTTPGSDLRHPMDTITTQDHHALVTATLGQDSTPQVRAFLATYFGSPADIGQAVTDPLRTVTTRDRFGLVTVEGVGYQITDIGMRMLEPHELLRAQFGRFADSYDLSAAKTKTAKV